MDWLSILSLRPYPLEIRELSVTNHQIIPVTYVGSSTGLHCGTIDQILLLVR